MDKKQDLINVFNFIAEYIREEQSTNSKKELLVEDKKIKNDYLYYNDISDKLGNTITKDMIDPKYIKEVMDRVDEMDKINSINNQLLDKMKTFEDKLIVDKNIDETIELED